MCIRDRFFVVLGWGIFTANQPGAPLGLLLQKLFIPQGGIAPLYYLRNYGVLLVLGGVCSSTFPRWLWGKISKNTVAKLCLLYTSMAFRRFCALFFLNLSSVSSCSSVRV